MNTALVGSTGFVGGNIAARHAFDALYHSTDITAAYGTAPELLIYAGLPAAKYLANKDGAADMAVCRAALANIKAIQPQRTVLISTVDVYKAPIEVDENACADACEAYGANRAWLESEVSRMQDSLIIRLPALFGSGLKKNFVYDMLELTPSMLKSDKYAQLSAQAPIIATAYAEGANGFYKLKPCDNEVKAQLRAFFADNSFNAMSFTHSRSEYQYYDLTSLWHDITWALAANLRLVNISTEPVSAAELYAHITHGKTFVNEQAVPCVHYDVRSKYAALFGGANGYMYNKHEQLDALAHFVRCYNGGSVI